MKVSLVICTYNRMHTLPTTLEAAMMLRYKELEIIVVDGPSSDGTEAYIQQNWSDKVRLLKCPVANLSMSRNIGIAGAVGDIVAFTDDDGLPEPDWLDLIVPCYMDPRVGAVGGFVRDHTGVDFQTRYIVSDRHGFSNETLESLTDVPPSAPGTFSFPRPIGVNSSFRRSVLLDIGGFDEHYAYFYDEVDVAIRLIDAGYRIVFCPEAQVHHKYAKSHIRNEKGLPKTWAQIGRSTSYFCLKNAPQGQTLSESLDVIDRHKRNFTSATYWAASTAQLSDKEISRLLGTLDFGINQGIQEAFSFPGKHLLKSSNTDPGQWLELPRTLDPSERQRIAFVTDLYPPRDCGGVAVFMHELAVELANLGHEITVITFGEKGRRHTVDFEEGVWVHRINSDDVNGIDVLVPYMPTRMNLAAQAVLNELDRVNPRRQFTWVIGSLWDLHVAAAISSGRYKVGLYLVTSYQLMLASKPEWHPGSLFFKQHVGPMIECERWALTNADHVISSTSGIKKDCENAYGVDLDKVPVLPFGLRDCAPVPGQTKANGIKLLFVGRFERRKGIDLLFEALPGLLNQFPNLSVDLVGDNTIPFDGGRSAWEMFCAEHSGAPWFDRVQAQGVVSDAQLLGFYDTCDVFVAPSRYESFGLIYLEAMRFGKPCVGFAVGGVPEVVLDGETGILAENISSDALEKALSDLCHDEALRHRMGRKGRMHFKTMYTVECFAERFIAQLSKVSSQHLK